MIERYIKISANEEGVPIGEIASQLHPAAAYTFLEAVAILRGSPNCATRNAKWKDALDGFYAYFDFLKYLDWREMNIVVFENLEDYEEVFNELMTISLHISKLGRKGYTMDSRLFIEHGHISLGRYEYIDFLNFADSVVITHDDRITLSTDWLFGGKDERRRNDIC